MIANTNGLPQQNVPPRAYTGVFYFLEFESLIMESSAKFSMFSTYKVTTLIGQGIGGIIGSGIGFLKAVKQKITNESSTHSFGKTIKDYTIKGVSTGHLYTSDLGGVLGFCAEELGMYLGLIVGIVAMPVGIVLALVSVLKSDNKDSFVFHYLITAREFIDSKYYIEYIVDNDFKHEKRLSQLKKAEN